MAYSDKVIEHYENPRNVGTFKTETDVDASEVGTGLVGAPACGDVMRLEIRVKDGMIADAKFKTFGCGSAIASSSLATEMIKGMTLDQAAQIKNTQIVEELAGTWGALVVTGLLFGGLHLVNPDASTSVPLNSGCFTTRSRRSALITLVLIAAKPATAQSSG